MVRCGFGVKDITPRLGLNMPGYYEERPAKGVTLPLCARSAVFESDGVVTGVCALDLLHATREMCLRIREITGEAGIDSDGIMITGLHIHTGAPVEPENDRYAHADPEVTEEMCRGAAESIISAYRSLQPCKVGFGKGSEKTLAFNRRFFMKDGSVKTWPGIKNPMLDREAGPVDTEVDVLRVETADSALLGFIVGFACHPDSTGGENYCSDYPGALAEEIKKRYGNVGFVFLNGPSGDITHVDYRGIYPIRENHFLHIGKTLADDVEKIDGEIVTSVPESVGYAKSTLPLRRHFPDDEEYENALAVIAAYERGEKLSDRDEDGFEKPTTGDDEMMELSFARDIVKLRDSGKKTEDTDLRVVRIGDNYICGMPGENFASLALDFRKKSAHANNILVEQADGSGGYIGPDSAYDEGGYEVRYSTYVCLDRGNGEIINEELLKIEKKA